MLFCLLSSSGERPGFGSGDYKPNRGLSDNEKLPEIKPGSHTSQFRGGKKSNRKSGTGVRIKIGIAVENHSYPSSYYYYKCAWLLRLVNYCFPTAEKLHLGSPHCKVIPGPNPDSGSFRRTNHLAKIGINGLFTLQSPVLSPGTGKGSVSTAPSAHA